MSYLKDEVVIPRLQSLGEIVIVGEWVVTNLDWLTSIVLGKIVAELRVFRETFPCRLTVIQADAAIQQVQAWSEFDGTELPPTMTMLGRGGTDFRPVFDWLAQQHDAATVVLYATDGMGSFPSKPPPWPVIWLLTPDAVTLSELPFGVGVRMFEI
jgi:predicted metal-dependent peptidase